MPVDAYDTLKQSAAAPGEGGPRGLFRLRRGYRWIVALILLLGAGLTLAFVPKVQMGLGILRWKMSGSLPDVSYADLYRMVRPGSHFYLSQLAKSPNPYAAIRNPYVGANDILQGKELFRPHCAGCHGSEGTGGNGGPSLQGRHMKQGSSDWALFRTISFGVHGTSMQGFDLPWLDKWRLVAFLSSVTQDTQPASSQIASAARPVSFESLLSADRTPDRWLTYSGSYDGHRFSPNNQITRANAAGLRLLWMRQYSHRATVDRDYPLGRGRLHVCDSSRPIASKHLIRERSPDLDLRSANYRNICRFVAVPLNRGFAVLGGTLFLGTLDAHLVALEMKRAKCPGI